MRIPSLSALCLLVACIVRAGNAASAVQVSATVVHQKHRNWLQLQVTPVAGCQEVVVDSVKVAVGDTGTLWIGDPLRNLEVWWRLEEASPKRYCGTVRMARTMVEIPAPRKSVTIDSLLERWLPRKLVAYGKEQVDTVAPAVVDHAGMSNGVMCVLFNIICPPMIKDSATEPGMSSLQWLDSLQRRIAEGGAVFLVRKNSSLVPKLLPFEPGFGPGVSGLGIVSPWTVGNQAWRETVPVNVAQAWGVAAPAELSRPDGKILYRWNNARPACCEHCDTVCGSYPGGDTLSSNGPDLLLGSDSIQSCYGSMHADSTTLHDIRGGDWLLLPSARELKSGILDVTFARQSCTNSWQNAIPVRNDTVRLGSDGISLQSLNAVLGARSGRASSLQVIAQGAGLRILGHRPEDGPLSVRIRTLSGRLLTETVLDGAERSVPLSGHGIFLVEARSARGNAVSRVVR